MPRRPPLSYLLAAGLLLALLGWLALGDLQRFQTQAPPDEAAPEQPPTRVEYRPSQARPHFPRLLAQGQLRPIREVTLRTRREGQVAELTLGAGARVTAGEPLLGLAQDSLAAQLERAEDELTLARAELAGADSLRQRELISRTEQLRLRAGVSRAAAEVAELRQALDDTRPTAPFDGVLDRLDAELGDILQPGEAYGRLVDDRRLIASAWVSQRDAQGLAPGLAVEVRLQDGETLPGELTHVASRADDATRTFHLEATLDNPERLRLAGASASLSITLPARNVHRLSPALLELDADNRLRVKHLDDQDRVVATPVTLVEADASVARVAGLPERVRLITLGGGFVEVGERVTPVPAERGPAEQATNGQAANERAATDVESP
ncbi:efflux RND transporter periplasmic adaptor subunit [Halomonas campisalis]|uniref:Efflux RND transporter periplasmic adaptor subunit n=1 Tax=Billgrantia campisalis TaxID=74661 RepID=A0ABS9PBZ3_9GAMM|nr:efflux RND transporter periplasmic adaptor subunit [Halomonas campisalis]MCG6658635.1 efflux RND transporter periplasmic adaptor subunit [Halomonas campisalis]MDR5864099.1 efflux RND transporter periplasmic adaptor subunit [Halomonas campisalis]